MKPPSIESKYAYNINRGEGFVSNIGTKETNFKGFYDDIEKNDVEIKKSAILLKKIKNSSIREFVYANRRVPETWKNKIGYQNSVIKILAKDDNFLRYVSRGGKISNGEDNRGNIMSARGNTGSTKGKLIIENKKNSTQYSNFPKVNSLSSTNFQKNNEKIENTGNIFEEETTENLTTKNNEKFRRKFSNIRNHKYKEKDIFNILEEFRNKFNLKEKLEEIIRKEEEGLGVKASKSFVENENNTSNKKDNKLSKNLNKTAINFNPFQRAQNMRMFQRQEAFRESIYNNLLPSEQKGKKIYKKNYKNFPRSMRTRQKKDKKDLTEYGPFLNTNSDLFYKKVEIGNPLIKNQLASINNYGPYYSFCPPCRNRNMEFYKNMEEDKCFKLIQYIKKIRMKSVFSGKDNENDQKEESTKNNNEISDKENDMLSNQVKSSNNNYSDF